MCGIAGVWSKKGGAPSEALVGRMLSCLSHRGPDAQGIWSGPGLVLGHRRLKILDLSDRANQPFTDGKDAIVFNGEIFNYKELKAELSQKCTFTTTSDTEVLFRSLQRWGEEALLKIEGQFAFAFYCAQSRSLMLARDHAGICPLYVRNKDGDFYFSSEIRPLLELGKSDLDRQGVVDYFTYRYNIQNGRTLFTDVKRFPPAHFLKIDVESGESVQRRYWRLEFQQQQGSPKELQKQFDNLFNEEVSRQQAADVPVGLYLSGGIDSGALLAGFSKNTSEINAFTLLFSKGDAERGQVDALSRRYRFEKKYIEFSPQDFSVLEDAVLALEEPFGDLIICANYTLAQYASKAVRVVLSGEGGDESFCGYDHQRAFAKMAALTSNRIMQKFIPQAWRLLPSRLIAMSVSYPGRFGAREKQKTEKVFMAMGDSADAYIELVRLFDAEELRSLFSKNFSNGADTGPDTGPIREIFNNEKERWQALMRVEIEQLVLIVNLLKQDRFSMHFSLEGRVPLVSRKILEFAGTLSYSELFGKDTKRLLLGYAASAPVRKRPFSILGHENYVNSMLILMDRYLTPEAIDEMGIFSPDALKLIRARMKEGGIIDLKQAMCILVFAVWWGQFKRYLN